MHAFTFQTARLQARPLTTSDEDLFVQLYTDEETMRFIGAPLSPERARASFVSAVRGMSRDPIERLFLTMVEQQTGDAVGFCCLQNFDRERRRAEGGIMILPAARTHGYSKEIYIGLIPQVFARLPVDEIWVQFARDHLTTQRAITAIGFIPNEQADSRDGTSEKRIWSVYRDSWRPPAV